MELANANDIRLLLKDQFPAVAKYRLGDRPRNAEYDIVISSRRMGEDNGKDQLVNVTNYLRQRRDFTRKIARKATPEEVARMAQLVQRW